MKKILAFLLAMLLLTGLLAGCGGGDDTPAETAEPEVEETEAPEVETIPGEPEEGEEEYDPEEAGPMLDPRLVGVWLWDEHGAYEYNFFADGTGNRGVPLLEDVIEFTWFITEALYLVIETEEMAERWDYDIDVDALTLTSRQVSGTQYSYTRLGMSAR